MARFWPRQPLYFMMEPMNPPNRRPRLVALDLDGTLVAPGEVISENALHALGRVAEQGVLISTASGRDWTQQRPLAQKYGWGLGRIWPHFLMTNELLLYRKTERAGGWEKGLSSEEAASLAYEPIPSHNEPRLAHWRLHADDAIAVMNETVARLKAQGVAIERASDDAFVRDRALIDSFLFGTEQALAAYAVLKEVMGNRPWLRPNCVQGGNGKYHIQLTPTEGGKGATLLALAAHLGLDPEDVLAVGDSGNDEDMLSVSRSFQKATVANGDPHIQAMVLAGGGYVAKASVAEGLLEVLDHWGFGSGGVGLNVAPGVSLTETPSGRERRVAP